jgi:hypothetical protein
VDVVLVLIFNLSKTLVLGVGSVLRGGDTETASSDEFPAGEK